MLLFVYRLICYLGLGVQEAAKYRLHESSVEEYLEIIYAIY